MPYVEHVPTVGELILEPFFGKKGIYDLKKIDKETVLNILKKFDMDYEGYQVTSKRNVGMPVFEASKGNDHITIMGKEDITGADREIKLTVVEEKGNVFSELQYIRAGIPGRFGVYLNKLTYFEDGMETSQSREVYSPKELTFEQPIVLIGDRKIYAKDVLQKVDPANLILHLPDTKQVINQVVGVQSEKSLHFTYTVGLNQYSNVDDYVSPALSISLDGNSENVPINMKDITKKEIQVTQYIATSKAFAEYMSFFRSLKPIVSAATEETVAVGQPNSNVQLEQPSSDKGLDESLKASEVVSAPVSGQEVSVPSTSVDSTVETI